jgi:hypothetical protein
MEAFVFHTTYEPTFGLRKYESSFEKEKKSITQFCLSL